VERFQLCEGLFFDLFNVQELLQVYSWLFYLLVPAEKNCFVDKKSKTSVASLRCKGAFVGALGF
jgi:hypothetical protein